MNKTFEHVVIGSSPMMILQAYELARNGASVCIVDRNERIGGAWQTDTFQDNKNKDLEVETACHLIEPFPGVYEYLEEVSGVEFVALTPQPIRVFTNGRQAPYFNPFMLLLAALRTALGYFLALIKQTFLRQNVANDLINYKGKFSAFFRYQLKYLFASVPMKAPNEGFVSFIKNLLTKASLVGTHFIKLDIIEIKREEESWLLISSDGQTLKAGTIHATTACGLRQQGNNSFVANSQDIENRTAIVIEVKTSNIITSQTYSAFWQDPHIFRISRIDTPNNAPIDGPIGVKSSALETQLFLIETRSLEAADDNKNEPMLRKKLEISNILRPNTPFKKLGYVNCDLIQNTDQLPRGELTTNFHAYYSNGNLAAGLAYWLEHQKPN